MTSNSQVPGHGMGDFSLGVTGLGDSSRLHTVAMDSRGRVSLNDSRSFVSQTVVTGDHGAERICTTCGRKQILQNNCTPPPVNVCKCNSAPQSRLGQVIVDNTLRAPPGCTRVPSYNSLPGISGWLAIPDGSLDSWCASDVPLRPAGAVDPEPSRLGVEIGTVLGWSAFAVGAVVGYRYINRRNRRGR